MKKLCYVFCLVLLAGCNLGGGELRPLNPPFFPAPPQGGPQEFQQGWKDGCETGFAAHGSDIYRTSLKFKQDPSLVTNPAYYKGWKDAENYCRTYIYEYVFRSTELYCSLDGLENDCAGKKDNYVPGFGGKSTDDLESGIFGGGTSGVGGLMGGATEDNFIGNTTDGIGSLLGNW